MIVRFEIILKKKLEKSKMKKKYFDTTQPKTETRISPFSMKD